MTDTPRLSQVLETFTDARLRELHFALPGKRTAYDPQTNQASVLPQVKRGARGLPIINNVPVVFPRAAASHLRLPAAPGDFGQLLFNERSIDLWQSAGREIDPEDARKMDINDAVFIPGLYPLTAPMEKGGADGSLEAKNAGGYLEITDAGKFKLANAQAELFDELVNLLGQLVDGFNQLGTAHQTNTIFGPQKPINFARYSQIKIALDGIKAKIEALKAE